MMLRLFVKVTKGLVVTYANKIIKPFSCHLAIDTLKGDCDDGDLRLEGGMDVYESKTREGRVEICFNNAWGTVCNTSFSVPDALVACNQLVGFEREGN